MDGFNSQLDKVKEKINQLEVTLVENIQMEA